MLKEIYCDKFISNGKIRNKIEFHKGLNIIEGSDTGKNSIGKSTFLMIIDFVFGGMDYVEKLKDVNKNVGDHNIYFKFTFDKDYFFCRSTKKDLYKSVFRCDENYNLSESLSLNEYCSFLLNMYEIKTPDLTFRSIVSRFFRIYNKENVNELLPLRNHNNEKPSDSIKEIIKLFKLYSTILSFSNKVKEIKDEKDSLSKAYKYNYFKEITKKEYATYTEEIIKLEADRKNIIDNSEKGITELTSEQAEYIVSIRKQLSNLKRVRSKFYNEINSLKLENELHPKKYEKDFKDLQLIFGDVDIKKIKEIENFHRELSSILANQTKNAKAQAWANINFLNSSIEELESKIQTSLNANNVSRITLLKYAEIDKQIDLLKNTIKKYEDYKKIKDDLKTAEACLNAETLKQCEVLESKINGELKAINDITFNENTNAPKISFQSASTYTFETPDDIGTGSNYKGFALLDYVILKLTELPAMVHDSIMFTNMSFNRIEKTLELYKTSEKQIFISIDKALQLNEDTQKIIKDNCVLSLSPDGNELFGHSWNKKETNND